MGIIGTFGNCYIYKDTDKFGISSSVAILRANPEVILPEYLYFVISSNSFFQIVEKYKGDYCRVGRRSGKRKRSCITIMYIFEKNI